MRPESGHGRILGRAVPGFRPSPRWYAVAAAVAVATVAAGCSASAPSAAPAAKSGHTAGLAAAEGPQGTSASVGVSALGISLGTGQGAAATGAAGPAPAATTVTATGLAVVTYTSPALGGGLNHPQGVSAANGTVYVSNSGAGVLASIANGTTAFIAGSLADNGETGDGGPASAATLAHPTGTAEDTSGDVYIADTEDNVVREITPDGVIHLIAGNGREGAKLAPGNASQSELDQPQAVTVTPNGTLLIADTGNNRVLAVTSSGKIGVVAGDSIAGYRGDNGPGALAELNQPSGVTVDGQGNVYIADSSNNVIRRVDVKTGIITTVAGDFAADQASDGQGADSGDGGPATAAQLQDPQGVAVDGAGNLFIADTFNNAIRVVTPAGTISTLWTGQNTPYAIATDSSAAGTVYFADTASSRIEKGTFTTSPSASS